MEDQLASAVLHLIFLAQRYKLKHEYSNYFPKSAAYPYQSKSVHHNAPLHAQYLLFIF